MRNRPDGKSPRTVVPFGVRYTYEIAAQDQDSTWRTLVTSTATFTRDPRATARGLLERWINDSPERVPGGSRIYVFDGRNADSLEGLAASVRVSIFRAGELGELDEVAAVAYLCHSVREYGPARPRRHLWRRTREFLQDSLLSHTGQGSSLVAG